MHRQVSHSEKCSGVVVGCSAKAPSPLTVIDTSDPDVTGPTDIFPVDIHLQTAAGLPLARGK